MKPAADDAELSGAEAALWSYARDLERFVAEPEVTHHLLRLQYNLLFRARGFSEDLLHKFAQHAEDVAERHVEAENVRAIAAEGLLLAVAAIADDRVDEALAMYARVRVKLLAAPSDNRDLLDGLQNTLSQLLDFAHKAASPSLMIALWSDVQPFVVAATREDFEQAWCPLIESCLASLVRSDPLAAFALWLRVVEWSRLHAASDVVVMLLLASAAALITRHARESTLRVLFKFVASADAARMAPNTAARARFLSIASAVEFAATVSGQRLELVGKELSALRELEESERDRLALELLERHDEECSALLELATEWESDEVFAERGWIQQLNMIAEHLNGAGARSPSFHAYSKRIHQRTVAELEELARMARARVTVAPVAAWLDSPLAAFAWVDEADATSIVDVASRLVAVNGPLVASTIVVEKMRRAPCTFYSHSELFELQARWNDHHGIIYLLWLGNQPQVIARGGLDLPTIKKQGYFSPLADQQTAVDFIRFYTSLLCNDGGHFTLVYGRKELAFEVPPSDEMEQAIQQALHESWQPIKDLDMAWRVRSLMQRETALYNVVLEVTLDGEVEMLTGEPMTTGLVRRPSRFEGPLRVRE